MKLKDALKRAIKICPKAKDQALFRSVRFIARKGEDAPRIFTSDGICMVSVPVDDDELPDMLVGSEGITNAVKDSGDLHLGNTEDGQVCLRGDSVVYRLVVSDNLDYFPGVPVTPQNFTPFIWWIARKVIHAAPKEKPDMPLPVVHFERDYVEAFDQVRLARVGMETPWSGFVPARLFKGWPRGGVELAFTEHHVYFRVGEELRIANSVKLADYPDTNKLSAAIGGGSYVVGVGRLKDAVKQATEVSPLNLVMLRVADHSVQVVACDATGELDTFHCEVPLAIIPRGVPGTATVDGKLLLQTLKECDTPTIKMTAGDGVDPLRIESGYLVASIWQRYWE